MEGCDVVHVDRKTIVMRSLFSSSFGGANGGTEFYILSSLCSDDSRVSVFSNACGRKEQGTWQEDEVLMVT